MGAWGYGNFQNDAARDWLAGQPTEADVLKKFDEVLDARRATAKACAQALVAAELVAGALGRPASGAPDVVRVWRPTEAGSLAILRERALAAARAVEQESPLQELFDEDERHAEWHDEVGGLMARLRDPADTVG